MGKQILQKYTIFEVKCHLAEIEKQYGKERVSEMFGKDQAVKFNREFEKAVAERLVPYWKDIQDYEHGGFGMRLRVRIKYIFRDRSAECAVPKHVLQAIVDDMLPDIRAFFESEEGKREFEEWKLCRERNQLRKKNIGKNSHIHSMQNHASDVGRLNSLNRIQSTHPCSLKLQGCVFYCFGKIIALDPFFAVGGRL